MPTTPGSLPNPLQPPQAEISNDPYRGDRARASAYQAARQPDATLQQTSEAERAADAAKYGSDIYQGIPTSVEIAAGYESGNPSTRYSQGNIRTWTLERERRKKEADLRLMAEQELKAARSFNPYQSVRYTEGMKMGGRTIQEGATARSRGTESGLAKLGLAESPMAEAYRRADREYTASQQQDLSSNLILKELDTHFQNEQTAIARLFSAGQEEAAFARQGQLLEQQFRYNLMLEQERTKGAFLGGLGEALGSIPGMAIMGLGGGGGSSPPAAQLNTVGTSYEPLPVA